MALTKRIDANIGPITLVYGSLPTAGAVLQDGGEPGDRVVVTGVGTYIIDTDHSLFQIGNAVVGFVTGQGGAVSQATDRTTTVVLSTLSGTITTQATSLAAGAEVSFTVTNTLVAATDVVVTAIKSGGTTPGSTWAAVTAVAAGSFIITLTNLHATVADTAALVINFAVIKAVAA